ncbi:MAG: ribonuclease P protein component 1 [Nitrososphaerota archaeon]
MITQENIALHELIGLDTEILDSSNKQIVGLSGKIVDETKSMFALYTKSGLKMIPKHDSKWQFKLDDTQAVLDGTMLNRRPHDRLGAKL